MNLKQDNFSSKPKQISQAAMNVSIRVFGDLSNIGIITINDTEIAQTIFDNFKKVSKIPPKEIKESFENFFDGFNLNDDNAIKDIASYDILITGFSTKNTIFNSSLISNILKQRKQKPLVIIDCGIPGNVDNNARSLGNCFVFDLNDLEQIYSQELEYEILNSNQILSQKEIHVFLENFYKSLDFSTNQKVIFENKLRKFLENSGLQMYDALKVFLKTFK